MGGGDVGAVPVLIEDIDADKKEEKQGEKKLEELVCEIGLYGLMLKFEKIYGPEPQKRFFWGRRRLNNWLDSFHIFVKGARVGAKKAEDIISGSGWLRPEIQEMFEARKQR